MHIFLTLEGTTLIVVCVHNLGSELVSHRLTATLACITDKVLHRDALLAVRTDFGRNLESSTTDTTALHLHLRSDVVESLLPYFEWALLLLCHLFLYDVERVVENLV